MEIRIQKFISETGVASRRAGEQLLTTGRIEVNGRPVQSLGIKVDPEKDTVRLDGRVLKPRSRRYVALNKPRGFVCSKKKKIEKQRTIMELIPEEWNHLYPVGRLDVDSEGLIFLTNDGRFCMNIAHPRFGVLKTYHAIVEGALAQEDLERLVTGVKDEDELLQAHSAVFIRQTKKRSTIELKLMEGKNREIRRMFDTLGFHVSRLIRVRIGSIRLGELPPGKWRMLTKPEIKSLLPK